MPRLSITLVSLLALSLGTAGLAADSSYTELGETHCTVLEHDVESASSISECPGFAGYQVLLDDEDGRQSLRLIDSHATEHDLDFYSTVASGFSTLGAKLEWRFERTKRGIVAHAAIVRLNAQVSEGQSRSYLVVIRLRDGPVCVIDRIDPGSDQNQLARDSADQWKQADCR